MLKKTLHSWSQTGHEQQSLTHPTRLSSPDTCCTKGAQPQHQTSTFIPQKSFPYLPILNVFMVNISNFVRHLTRCALTLHCVTSCWAWFALCWLTRLRSASVSSLRQGVVSGTLLRRCPKTGSGWDAPKSCKWGTCLVSSSSSCW